MLGTLAWPSTPPLASARRPTGSRSSFPPRPEQRSENRHRPASGSVVSVDIVSMAFRTPRSYSRFRCTDCGSAFHGHGPGVARCSASNLTIVAPASRIGYTLRSASWSSLSCLFEAKTPRLRADVTDALARAAAPTLEARPARFAPHCAPCSSPTLAHHVATRVADEAAEPEQVALESARRRVRGGNPTPMLEASCTVGCCRPRDGLAGDRQRGEADARGIGDGVRDGGAAGDDGRLADPPRAERSVLRRHLDQEHL